MKTNRIKATGLNTVIMFCLILILASCSNEVDFGEQYKKTVYLVNSNNLLYVGEHSFDTDNDAIAISVYCASSEPITQDLRVRLKIDRFALDSLNALQLLANPSYTNRVMLPEDNYQLNGEQYVTIKAGKQYGVLYIPFDFSDLDPSIPYVLPLSLVSNNADYQINPKLKSIVYQIEMINQYAGNYNGSSQTSPASIAGIQPVLKALSVNKVRMPIHNLSDDEEDILTNFMVLTIAKDNSVSISPWGVADVTDLGGSKYDPERQSFELYYQFTDAAANRQNVTAFIRNIDAPPLEEDEF
ncbi:BT_3044 domain-containing protein [Proteiniphilum sp.]|uniref:BT_3044 domain-containing protein n=1 Tax=Proteiniphilum sp. TaxID=1926877 RepID=UPI002B1EBEE4|nr:DUF4361 domain-containing protein [Proteiniphilum sp.]MEA4919109.1 DUF4361 domain-containing protein [Proteiniphilum sp.]